MFIEILGAALVSMSAAAFILLCAAAAVAVAGAFGTQVVCDGDSISIIKCHKTEVAGSCNVVKNLPQMLGHEKSINNLSHKIGVASGESVG